VGVEFKESLATILERDLDKLSSEITQYPSDESIWLVPEGVKNSGGNLCLHLCGNLQHYFGTVIGKTGYARNRPLEFSAKNISRQSLLQEIEKAKKAVLETLRIMTEDQLLAEYPEVVFGKPMTTLFFFIHLSAHLGYHLGQINYHRRLAS
jgi:Protein of unknown function (DUF1572)